MFKKRDEKKTSCGRKLFYMLVALSVVSIGITTAWYFLYFAKDVESPVGDCGGCHCIPDESTNFECPSGETPPSSYPEETLNAWRSQTIINPFILTCNPYSDGILCDTEPPLDPDFEWARLGETAVCAIHYEQENSQRRQEEIEMDGDALGDNATLLEDELTETFLLEAETCENKDTKVYRIQSYPSRQAAELAGGFVTHVGSCGVCSTLQDLAVYANMDSIGATSPGNFCRRQAETSFENGLACYRGLGMTQDCAKIWADTSWNTAKSCFGSCVLKNTLPQFRGSSDTEVDIDTNTTESSGHAWYDLPATLRERFVQSEKEKEESGDDNKVAAMPSNGPAPECALNDCITCNDEASAPIFEKFAGRSRRRSGLLSTAARQCSTLPNIIQSPCPDTLPLVL